MAAAIWGCPGTLMALPMSWHRLATTTSSSAPSRSARVAVWRQWVSWSVAKPSVMSDSERSMSSTRSATRPWFWDVSVPITAHCSAVDSSMLRKLVTAVMAQGYVGNRGQRLLRLTRMRITAALGVGLLSLTLLGACSDDDTPVTAGDDQG